MLITQALGQVGTEYRVVLVLRHIADLDYEEIANILDIPVGTVRSRLARGRAQLSEIVGNQLAEPTRQNSADDALPPKDAHP
jgi:RNA polymerase sigma-70 factor (ECF subfamily)